MKELLLDIGLINIHPANERPKENNNESNFSSKKTGRQIKTDVDENEGFVHLLS